MIKIKFERPRFVRHVRPKIQTLGALNLQNALKQTFPMPMKIHARKYIGDGKYEICFSIKMPNGFFTTPDCGVVKVTFHHGKLLVDYCPNVEPSEQWRHQTRCFSGATK